MASISRTNDGPSLEVEGATSRDDLEKWLAYLGIDYCICPWAWKGLGEVYGHSMGKGWVRVDTDPNCPEHWK